MNLTNHEYQQHKTQSISKKILLLCLCIGFTFGLRAQTEEKKWNVGLHGGVIQYHGDLAMIFTKLIILNMVLEGYQFLDIYGNL